MTILAAFTLMALLLPAMSKRSEKQYERKCRKARYKRRMNERKGAR